VTKTSVSYVDLANTILKFSVFVTPSSYTKLTNVCNKESHASSVIFNFQKKRLNLVIALGIYNKKQVPIEA
jgi:hypothetical protein